MFETYFKLGYRHILDVNGYDHVLFIIALCAIYSFRDWKKILVLVTAFTIGHSVTLALSALRIVVFPADVIEFLIPLTILLTALNNVIWFKNNESSQRINYLIALFFGFIHGLGFSNFLKQLVDEDESIVGPLFAFNVGLEVGQIIIVIITVALGFLITEVFGAKQSTWRTFVSGAAAGVAITLMLG